MNHQVQTLSIGLILILAGMHTVRASSVSFQIIAQGAVSGFQFPENLAIRDNYTFGALWANLTSINEAPPSPPQIDFSTTIVLAAIMGRQPSCGYSINITSINIENGSMWVNISKTVPPPGTVECMIMTSPYVFVRVDRFDGPAVFQSPVTNPQPHDPSQAPSSTLPVLSIIPILASIGGVIATLKLRKRNRPNRG